MTRLPEVKTLYDILPKGSEGGKEFARIVDLLLFHEARRAGKKITIFNDMAGDYHGLDSFAEDTLRKASTIGYQYKFYPTPFSASHRREIIQSLERTASKQRELNLRRWILVTPQNLVESTTRKGGGDVSWFNGLSNALGLKFEIEHWGHRQLISLFLQTQFLCLFYYPELIHEGDIYRKTIQDTRERYNDNLIQLYGDIQFIGMPIYRHSNATGVPMENIYIPLTVVPEGADDNNPEVPRTNPLTFLGLGSKKVILGAPGSGKSTLLHFLALIGFSEALQQRYEANEDGRLPILITLRRFADEQRTKANLSLIDYIVESIQGDFNLKSADLNFFEYYLETGQAIFLFDGLDELPDAHLKKTIRDQIRTLITTYPGNTTIITSRGVGYEYPIRFNEREFNHFQLAKLQLPEIKQFVRDWYSIRVDNEHERAENIKDLIQILQDEEHQAILELAENPLLLTIIALVHRIDAVLPDERVILYRKCTETLLSTWHTSKSRETESKYKGKVERRNRQRLEAIAYWMHCRSVGTESRERAVAPVAELNNFLAKYIADVEKPSDPDVDVEDVANEFLEFIKRRAGLLIELGEGQYSFFHLTFQEYLAAAHIKTVCEKDGVAKIWETISPVCDESRWLEVIRLLIASLESNDSQDFIIERLLSSNGENSNLIRAQLLGGLLLDAVEAAEIHEEDILCESFYTGSITKSLDQQRRILSVLRSCLNKGGQHEEKVYRAFQKAWLRNENLRLSLSLVAIAVGFPAIKLMELTGDLHLFDEQDTALLNLFFLDLKDEYHSILLKLLESLWTIQNYLYVASAADNFIAVACQAVTGSLGRDLAARRAFEDQLVTLCSGITTGPFIQLGHYSSQLFMKKEMALRQEDQRKWLKIESGVLELALNRLRDPDQATGRIRSKALKTFKDRVLGIERERELGLTWDKFLRKFSRSLVGNKDEFWQTVLITPELYIPILDTVCDALELQPRTQWWEALRVGFLPKMTGRFIFLSETEWKRVEIAFTNNKASESDIYSAAYQLIFDAWLYLTGYYKSSTDTLFGNLSDLTWANEAPPLQIAHCIRDLAYGYSEKEKDLKALFNSEDPDLHSIFEGCYWRSSEEEKVQQIKRLKRKRSSPKRAT